MTKETTVSASHNEPGDVMAADMGHSPDIDMEHYRATVPLWKRIWQHSLTQMMLLSVQAFCGPAMSDAIAGEKNNRSCDQFLDS